MMRRLLPMFLLAACTGGTAEPVGPDAAASAKMAQKLCYVFRYVEEKCRASGDLVELGDKSIKVEATITYEMNLPGGSARQLSVAFSMNGEPASYAVESLSKGTSVDDAYDRGAQEWAAFAGTAIVDAFRLSPTSAATHIVSKKPGDPPAVAQRGPFRVYPGVSDFRGAPKGGPVVDHAAVMAALAGQIDGLDASKPHSVLVSMKHDGKMMHCEKGQIDGSDAGAVCERALGVAWAPPLSPYTMRQFYMLVPADAVPEIVAPPVEEAPDGAE